MYKIMLLVRESTNQSLWTMYKTDDETEFETNDLNVLEGTIKELISVKSQKTIKVIQDMEYIVDVTMNGI